MGAVASGIAYISSMSYVTIRSEKSSRSFNIALCHVWKCCGIALLRSLENLSTPYEFEFKFYMGVVLIISASISILMQLLNEYRQRRGIVYNYRDTLDHDVSIANNYGKLFSKNEVIIERNNVSATALWKSTEQLILPKNKRNYSITWIFYIVFLKLHGSALFFYQLLVFTVFETERYFSEKNPAFLFWFIVAGGVVGCILTKFYRIHYIYPISGLTAIIAISCSNIFLNNTDGLVFVMWIYFFLMAINTGVPDIAVMEVSKIKYNEAWLAAGCVIEFLPFGILKFLELQEVIEFDFDTEGHLLNTLVVTIVLVITATFLILHMPNTFKKSLLQIQNEMLKHKKYFAFLGAKEKDFSSAPVSRDKTFENIYAVNNSASSFDQNPNNFDSVRSGVTHYDYERDVQNAPNLIPRIKTVKNSEQSSRKRSISEQHTTSTGISNYDYNSEIKEVPNIIPRARIHSPDDLPFRLKSVD